MAEIHLHNSTIQYRGTEVLTDLSLAIGKSKHAMIHGPIGSGKSMLLKAIAGQAQIKSGHIDFLSEGKLISKFDFHNTVSLVEFAEPNKFFNPKNHFYQQRYHHQMEDDEWSKSITIAALLKAKGFSLNEPHVNAYLKREKLLDLIDNKLIHLSSGQRRKLQLILSLLKLPKVLLLDAPYIGLDELSRIDLNEWLRELANDNDLQLIIACNVEDSPDWIDERIDISQKQKSGQQSKPKYSLQDIIQENEFESIPAPVIEVTNINISFGQANLFEGVSWAVGQGERVALLGDNGSGKSTLLSLIYADNPKAYCNDISMFGTKRGHGDSIWSVKKRIGFVSSELHLYFTEKYNCEKVIATGFFDTKFIPRTITAKEQLVIERFASYFNVSHLLNKPYAKTSLGEQKLVLFIRALVKNPELILLDEPYQAFTSDLIKKANDLLDHMMGQSNCSIVFITHYRNEIPDCIQKIYRLRNGKLELESTSSSMSKSHSA